MKSKLLILAAAALVAGAVAASVMAARGPDPGAVPSLAEVEQRVMSPFCPGLLLEACPHGQSMELRGDLAERIEVGWTNRQIDEWLVANYGQGVLGAPRGLAPWLIPALGILAGVAVVSAAALRSRGAGKPEPLPPSEEDRARVAADLGRFAEEETE